MEANAVDPETSKQAMHNMQGAKHLLALDGKDLFKDIRQLKIDRVIDLFDKAVHQYARANEVSSCDNLEKTAQRAIGTITAPVSRAATIL